MRARACVRACVRVCVLRGGGGCLNTDTLVKQTDRQIDGQTDPVLREGKRFPWQHLCARSKSPDRLEVHYMLVCVCLRVCVNAYICLFKYNLCSWKPHNYFRIKLIMLKYIYFYIIYYIYIYIYI